MSLVAQRIIVLGGGPQLILTKTHLGVYAWPLRMDRLIVSRLHMFNGRDIHARTLEDMERSVSRCHCNHEEMLSSCWAKVMLRLNSCQHGAVSYTNFIQS